MKKNLINEEINRLKLLMNYNSKKTLSENLLTVKKTILNEGAASETVELLLKDLVKTDVKSLKSSIETAIKDWGGITIESEKAVFYTSKNADEIIKAMEAGKVGVADSGKLAKSFFTKGSSAEIRNLGADIIVNTPSFVKRYGKMNTEEMTLALQENGRFSKEDAELLARKFENKNVIKPEPVKVEPEPVKVEPEPVKPKTWYKKTWDWLTRTKWGKRVMIGGSLLIAYLIWKSLTNEDDDLPNCLKGYVKSEQEFEQFLTNKYIIVTATDGSQITINTDGTAKSTNKTGEWEDKGSGVLVKFDDGTTVEIACKTAPDPCVPPNVIDPNTGKCSSGGGGGKWKDCSTFPLTRGCQSELVKKVQECIGANPDGKFGPKTEAKLIEKGYETTITQEVYDKIMKNCRGEGDTNTTTTTTYPYDPVYADDNDLD